MKRALKVIKNKDRVIKNREEKIMKTPSAATVANIVSFILVAKTKLCFRECAKIVQVAEDTGCMIEIASGTKSGNSESILSLLNLGIVAEKSLVLTIKGERNDEAFRAVSKILSGKADEES